MVPESNNRSKIAFAMVREKLKLGALGRLILAFWKGIVIQIGPFCYYLNVRG